LALQKDAPLHRAVQRPGVIVAIPILAGLHQVSRLPSSASFSSAAGAARAECSIVHLAELSQFNAQRRS